MTPEARSEALRKLTSVSNGARVDAQIRAFEQQYEMTSDEMRARVSRGELDTADTARWLVLLRACGR
jgi:hypothetical protein